MKTGLTASKKMIVVVIAAFAWFALILQLYLMLTGPAASLGFTTIETIINFFSYFTILSNLMVAISLTIPLLGPSSKAGKFFLRIKVQSAIALYIFIVGLVYNLVLRNIWQPKGWQLVADNLLHVIVPLLYVIYWIIYTPKRSLVLKDILPWLIFPAIYLTYSLITGSATGWYPYPFLNADLHSYSKVAVNSLFVLIAFVLFGLLMIAYNRYAKRSA